MRLAGRARGAAGRVANGGAAADVVRSAQCAAASGGQRGRGRQCLAAHQRQRSLLVLALPGRRATVAALPGGRGRPAQVDRPPPSGHHRPQRL